LAAPSAAGDALDVGRGESNAAFAADAGAVVEAGADADARDGDGPGSGVMMLTAGVEAAVGNSALWAYRWAPMTKAPRPRCCGAFHDGA